MLITTEGIIIRIGVDDISQLGRVTSGVKLMNLDSSKISVSPALPECMRKRRMRTKQKKSHQRVRNKNEDDSYR